MRKIEILQDASARVQSRGIFERIWNPTHAFSAPGLPVDHPADLLYSSGEVIVPASINAKIFQVSETFPYAGESI